MVDSRPKDVTTLSELLNRGIFSQIHASYLANEVIDMIPSHEKAQRVKSPGGLSSRLTSLMLQYYMNAFEVYYRWSDFGSPKLLQNRKILRRHRQPSSINKQFNDLSCNSACPALRRSLHIANPAIRYSRATLELTTISQGGT